MRGPRRAVPNRALLTLLALALGAPIGGHAESAERRAAPGFQIRSLTGERLNLDSLRTRGPVVLDFWATWCGPCVASLPELQRLHERHGANGLTVVGISVDGPRNIAKVRPFAARLGLRFPIAIDGDGALQEKYQVHALPTRFLVDRQGRVRSVEQGYRAGDPAALERQVEALLAEDAGRARPEAAVADTAPARTPAEP